MGALTNNIKGSPMTNSCTFSDHIKAFLPIRESNTAGIFNNSFIDRTRLSRSFVIIYRNSPVTKTLVPVFCYSLSCLFRLPFEFPCLCRCHSRSYTKFNHTLLLLPVFWCYLFRDFFLQVLHFKIAANFKLWRMASKLDTQYAMYCSSIIWNFGKL